ncbi:zinc metallopeptidase RseP [Pseudidiomarina aestuarii]|uniref:Zinc metalloprotease n=1 Tax=Pseudidiomarina aestuarii TaxID=624146 RepID=A0A6N4DK22_9GAMM|nr:zinc metallopeptidase RseP [Pseudidiomarina aestuarii]
MLSLLWTLAAFVVTLGILVTIHEFGHYWVARRCGVKVLTFSVGFGKALWSRQAQDGTVYQVGIIPLGGYVRMLDARVDEVSASEYPVSFNAQSVSKRAAIVAAGPIANFLLALLVLWLMYVIGVPSVKPIVGSVTPQSIAAQSDIETPAEIISINDRITRDWQAVNLALAAELGNDTVTIRLRDDNNRVQDVQLAITNWRLSEEQQPTFMQLGLEPFRPQPTLTIAYVADDSPAQRAGFQPGDKILAIDGTPQAEWSQTLEAIVSAPAATKLFTVERNGRQEELLVELGQRSIDGQNRGYLGVEAEGTRYPDEYRFVHEYGVIDAIGAGAKQTWELMELSVAMLGKLLTGTVSVSNLSGPVAIAEGAGVSASYGLVYFLGFLALISVNLGIINLLPLPVLDGGHLVFLAVEGIRGKAVSERVQDIAFRIGGALIFALMAIAISNDILRLTA